MPKNFELSGPAFIGLMVRDVAAAADFYENKLGLRRDSEPFPNGVGFLTVPIPFGLSQAPAGFDFDSIPRPIMTPRVWFKTANSQIVHDYLVEVGITILKPISEGRFGRQFMFADLDGYAITIYDRDAPPDGWNKR